MFEKHNGSHTAEYRSWRHMKERCHNPNSKAYYLYGARGISMCDRWRYSFMAFLEDMGKKPGPEYSIDRIDNDGNYNRENCRWATPLQQGQNRRCVQTITIGGESLPISQIANQHSIETSTLKKRLKKGWSLERSLDIRFGKLIEFDGKTYTYLELSKLTGIRRSLLQSRVDKLGWTIEEAINPKHRPNSTRVTFQGQTLTLNQWSKLNKIPERTLRARIKSNNWTLEEAMTTPITTIKNQQERGSQFHK